MTVKELYHKLRKVIENGQGDWEILLPDFKTDRLDIADIEVDEQFQDVSLVPEE